MQAWPISLIAVVLFMTQAGKSRRCILTVLIKRRKKSTPEIVTFCNFCRVAHKKTGRYWRPDSEDTKYYTGTYRDEGVAGLTINRCAARDRLEAPGY
jgi:hypothetical protein